MKNGVTPAYIATGAAAGLKRYLDENGEEPSLSAAADVLQSVSGLDRSSELAQMILRFYEMLHAGRSLKEMRLAADREKAQHLANVI